MLFFNKLKHARAVPKNVEPLQKLVVVRSSLLIGYQHCLGASLPILAKVRPTFFIDNRAFHARTETKTYRTVPVELPNPVDVHSLYIDYDRGEKP